MSASIDPGAPVLKGFQINIPRPTAPPEPEPMDEELSESVSAVDDFGVIPPMPESLEDTGIQLAVIDRC